MNRIFPAVLTVLLLTGCAQAPGEYSRTEPLMGTFVEIKLEAAGHNRTDLRKSVDSALEKARELEKRLSVFDPESEVNALNISKSMVVTEDLFGVLGEAGRISRVTGGEFDVTVPPVLKKRGFYGNMPAEIRGRIPDGTDGMGWENVTLEGSEKRVTLHNGAWIDLSGIAKGYIVDRMSEVLEKEGIDNYLINAGGDMRCGRRDPGGAWRVGIRKPGEDAVIAVLELSDMAVATSGDYENVAIDKDTGRTISHIIEPSREDAIEEASSSVTVLAPTAAVADALATGMMAMGKDRAVELAGALEGAEAIVVERRGGSYAVSFSRGAEKYMTGR